MKRGQIDRPPSIPYTHPHTYREKKLPSKSPALLRLTDSQSSEHSIQSMNVLIFMNALTS